MNKWKLAIQRLLPSSENNGMLEHSSTKSHCEHTYSQTAYFVFTASILYVHYMLFIDVQTAPNTGVTTV